MNMAALLCASVLDLFRVKLRHGFNIASLPANHFLNDGTRLLLFTGGPLANHLRSPAILSPWVILCKQSMLPHLSCLGCLQHVEDASRATP